MTNQLIAEILAYLTGLFDLALVRQRMFNLFFCFQSRIRILQLVIAGKVWLMQWTFPTLFGRSIAEYLNGEYGNKQNQDKCVCCLAPIAAT